jgi:two-component system LytT family response regulator
MFPDSTENARVLIVEDEIHSRRFLRELLQAEPNVAIVGEASNGTEGAEMVDALRPDLVFLDIQMPEMDAFEMVEKVGHDRMPLLIVVTAFAEYALRAYEIEALDYLCKPFDRARLHASLARYFRVKKRALGSTKELSSQNRRVWRRRLAIKEDAAVRFVPVERILWIEAANKYVVVRTADRSYVSRQTIQSIVEELSPEHFVRTSRSIIVRKNAVSEVRPLFHGDHLILLVDGTELALSRNYRESFYSEMTR